MALCDPQGQLCPENGSLLPAVELCGKEELVVLTPYPWLSLEQSPTLRREIWQIRENAAESYCPWKGKCCWSQKLTSGFYDGQCVLWDVMQISVHACVFLGGGEGKKESRVYWMCRPGEGLYCEDRAWFLCFWPRCLHSLQLLHVWSSHVIITMHLLECVMHSGVPTVSFLTLGDSRYFWVRRGWKGIISNSVPCWPCYVQWDSETGLHAWWPKETSNGIVKGQGTGRTRGLVSFDSLLKLLWGEKLTLIQSLLDIFQTRKQLLQ